MPPQKSKRGKTVKQKKKVFKPKKTVKRHRNSYSVEQKRQIVTYAKENGRNEAARQFGLNSSMVGRWVKASKSWVTELNQNIKRVGSGRTAFYPEAEKKLYDWIITQRKQGLGVTYTITRVKMMEILKEPDMLSLYEDSAKDFKASTRWMNAFMKRFKLSRRRRTKISQKLPSQTNELLRNFHQFIIRLRVEKSFELSNILNMDETPVWFDMAGNFTIDHLGEKTIHIRGTGNEKNRFTVVLTCAAGRNHFISQLF